MHLIAAAADERAAAVREIADALGRTVYRIDLSGVVSKYIGETEKNLKAAFSVTESHDVVLFFDEADALFGDRTDVEPSRFADEIWERMAGYGGIVVIGTSRSGDEGGCDPDGTGDSSGGDATRKPQRRSLAGRILVRQKG